ncbi:hypothetical protein [Haloarcula halophila]|uniref:hypothetical protein n=1 Tax=Haloarcula halophila TaxID=3032584 RepID=UPI0023E3940F|nr:hypothetical protein [Halomicroarcula sp. DFY41]
MVLSLAAIVGPAAAGSASQTASDAAVNSEISHDLGSEYRQVDCFNGSSSPTKHPNATKLPSRVHSLNETQFRMYWSGDMDYTNPNISRSQIRGPASFRGATACQDDIWFPSPPDMSGWNNQELKRYNSLGKRISVYPDRAKLKSNGSIRDAYIEIVRVTPSTVVHHSNNTTQYVRSNGSVKAIANYRVETPPPVIKPTRTVIWTVLDAEIEDPELWINGSIEDSVSSTTKPTFQFTNTTGNSTLKVNGTVDVALQKTTTFSANGTVKTSKQVVTQDISDTRRVRTQRLNGTTVYGETAVHRNSTGAVVNVPRMWQNIKFTTIDRTVHSRWFFYTRSPPGWEHWSKSTSPRSKPGGPPFNEIRPLQVHAVPIKSAPTSGLREEKRGADRTFLDGSRGYTRSNREFRVAKATGPNTSGPVNTSQTVNIDVSEEYRRTKRVEVRDAGSNNPYKYQDIMVKGIVRGSQQSARLRNPTVVHPANLTAKVTNRSKKGTEFEISILSPTDQPVKKGTLILDPGQPGARTGINITHAYTTGGAPRSPATVINTYASGTIVVRIPQTNIREFEMLYIPPEPWWDQYIRLGPVVAAMGKTRTTLRVGTGLPPFKRLIELAVVTLLWFGPLLGMLYLADVLTNGRLIGLYSNDSQHEFAD